MNDKKLKRLEKKIDNLKMIYGCEIVKNACMEGFKKNPNLDSLIGYLKASTWSLEASVKNIFL